MREPGSGDAHAVPDPTANLSRREVQAAYRKAHRHPWRRRSAIVIAGGLSLLLVVGVMTYFKLNSNITRVDVTKLLGKRPASSGVADKVTGLKPLNILVMGVDTRNLGTTKYGTTPGDRSDTNLLVHLSADRKSAVVVSIPRDSMTRAPRDCKDPNSTVADGPIRQWNANYGLGGPACVIRTFEGNTASVLGGSDGIRIDHFMVVNFLGFQSMVAALDGVQVCLPKAVKDKKSHLNLPAGRTRVSGDQALAFVRMRYSLGDGTDIGRIDRQQAFMSSMVQEATSSNLLLRPDKLLRFLDAATKSLATDPGLADFSVMREIAQSVIGLKTSEIRFVTVPVVPYVLDDQRRQWTPAADVLWKAINEDAPLPGSKSASHPKPTAVPTPTVAAGPALSVTPDKITVKINNASGVNGLARQAADDLRLQGFRITSTLTSTNHTKGVTIAYSRSHFEQARTVAAAFPGATLVRDASAGAVIRVTLGTGSPNVVAVPNRVGSTPLPVHAATASPTSTVTIKARSADSSICSK